jgi:hypothetical protein
MIGFNEKIAEMMLVTNFQFYAIYDKGIITRSTD